MLILLARLNTYRAEPAVSLRKADAEWNGLHWPGSIDSFHILCRRALTSMRRNSMEISDFQVVLRYMELIPKEKGRNVGRPSPSSKAERLHL